jgi:CheY-like chemotaxis protein
MCCNGCLQYSNCPSLTDLHAHPAEHSFLPAPHYHLCGPTRRECDLNCNVCGKLIRELPQFPSSQFIFGCCHRCAEYLRCDFAGRHRKNLMRGPELPESVSAASDGLPVRVLVVDDDAAFLEAMTDFLQGSPGFIVRGAGNGFIALRQFFNFKPHVVVLDLLMPEITGFDVCDAIRHSERSAKTRILAVTDDLSAAADLKARMSGADGCLKKPVKLDHLKQETWRLGQEAMGREAGRLETR